MKNKRLLPELNKDNLVIIYITSEHCTDELTNILLTTTQHFHYQACENGNTSGPHIHHQNRSNNLGPTMGGTPLQGPHWGLWILLTNGPVRGSQYQPYRVEWWHKVQ